MSHDFETVVKFNGREFEIIGNMFVQYFVRCTSETPPTDYSLQSALFKKMFSARESQIIEARAAGRF